MKKEKEGTVEHLGVPLKQASEYLGVSQDFLRRRVWRDEIEAYKIGSRLFFKRNTLDAFFEKGKL